MNKFSVIVTAGGTSSRYGKNKLLEIVNDKTVIEHTVNQFLDIDSINEIIIPANKSFENCIKKLFLSTKIKVVEGGDTRQQSVCNALNYVSGEYVLIHDGARPLISRSIIENVMNSVIMYDAVSVMTKTTDTIKEVSSDGKIIKTIDRARLYNTQTPQAFKTSLIRDAHVKLNGGSYTDDCSMLENLNIPVYMVEGDYKNIKITTKSDLDFVKIYI